MTRRRRWIPGLLIAGLVLGGLYLARARLLPAAARWLDVGVRPHRAEYVMVLPGDEQTRPFVAAALVKAGLARRVLVPKPVASRQAEDGIVPPTHEIIRRVLRHRGVPEEDIVLLDGRTSSTFGDMQALAAFLEASPKASVASVTIVTNDYHTRRARWVLARVLGDRSRHVAFISAPTDDFQADNWWQADAGFMAIAGEYLKLAYYAARYGQLRYWAAACAALTVIALVYRRRRITRTAGSSQLARDAGP